MPCKLTKNLRMTPKEKAEELLNVYFDFNGYCLNESNLETSKRFAINCCNLIRNESENFYQIRYYDEVIKEINLIKQ
jgi:hypothetical protein